MVTAPKLSRTLAIIVTLVFLFSFVIIFRTSAAELLNRSIVIADAQTNAATTHSFTFDISTAGNIGSIEFEYCSNDPFPGQPCTVPAGIDVSTAVLSSQVGETGFTIDFVNTTNNRLVLSRASALATPGQVQYVFDNITNPSVEGSGYVRLGTFVSTDGAGPRIDRGGLAYSINEGVGVDAFVPPRLIFCVGVSITGTDCGTAAGNSVDFGILTPGSTKSAVSQMAAGTNGIDGYTITVIGTTMTSGSNVIGALPTPTSSTSGVEQFGLNLVSNSSPLVGQVVAGPGTATPTSDYSQVNRYKFLNGDIVASSSLPSDMTKYTVSYIVNIPDGQKPGLYSSTLTYIALATF